MPIPFVFQDGFVVETAMTIVVPIELRGELVAGFPVDDDGDMVAMSRYEVPATSDLASAGTASILLVGWLVVPDDSNELRLTIRAHGHGEPLQGEEDAQKAADLAAILDRLGRLHPAPTDVTVQSSLRLPKNEYQTWFNVPNRLWAGTTNGLGELWGVRFEYRARGIDWGWVAFDSMGGVERVTIQTEIEFSTSISDELPLECWAHLNRQQKKFLRKR